MGRCAVGQQGRGQQKNPSVERRKTKSEKERRIGYEYEKTLYLPDPRPRDLRPGGAAAARPVYHVWRTGHRHFPVDDLLVDHRPCRYYHHRIDPSHRQRLPQHGAHDRCHLPVLLREHHPGLRLRPHHPPLGLHWSGPAYRPKGALPGGAVHEVPDYRLVPGQHPHEHHPPRPGRLRHALPHRRLHAESGGL